MPPVRRPISTRCARVCCGCPGCSSTSSAFARTRASIRSSRTRSRPWSLPASCSKTASCSARAWSRRLERPRMAADVRVVAAKLRRGYRVLPVGSRSCSKGRWRTRSRAPLARNGRADVPCRRHRDARGRQQAVIQRAPVFLEDGYLEQLAEKYRSQSRSGILARWVRSRADSAASASTPPRSGWRSALLTSRNSRIHPRGQPSATNGIRPLSGGLARRSMQGSERGARVCSTWVNV